MLITVIATFDTSRESAMAVADAVVRVLGDLDAPKGAQIFQRPGAAHVIVSVPVEFARRDEAKDLLRVASHAFRGGASELY